MSTTTLGLHPDAIVLGHRAATLAEVLTAAAAPLCRHSGADPDEVARALQAIAGEAHFALGGGIAVPHVAIDGLSERAVTLVRTAEPLPMRATDGAPVDLFFVVLYPAGDPSGHLQFLAHLAAMCRSRVFRDGLREARNAADAVELVAAAEARLRGAALTTPPTDARRGLALIAVSGERAADSILVGLVREDLGSGTIVDAQTVQDAASREVPLFAGFRDLFGDPGGRRLIMVFIDIEHADALAGIVQQACEEERSAAAELVVVPITRRWQWGPAPGPARRAGH